MKYAGDFKTSATVPIYFTTHAQTGAAVAPSSGFEAADVKIYKNGSATERASASGVTMTSPFDAIAGLHCVTIDLSDNTDSGFYAAGNTYTVVLSPDETVDGISVLTVLAQFSVERVSYINGSRTWWVDTSSGNDSNSGLTRGAAKATFAAAHTAASAGDTIRVVAGTYAVQVTITKNNLTIEGDGDTTIFSPATGVDAWDINADNVTMRRLKIISPNLSAGNGSTGINIEGTEGFTAEYIVIDAQDDGIYATDVVGASFFRISHCHITASQHGVAILHSKAGLIEHSYIRHNATTNGDYGSVGGHYAAWLSGDILVDHCQLYSSPNVAALAGHSGVVGVNGSGLAEPSHVILRDSNIVNVFFGTVGAYSIAGVCHDRFATAQPVQVDVEDCSFHRIGAAGLIDMDFNYNSNGTAKVFRSNVDSTKVLGYVTIMDKSIADTLADTAELQGDWVNGGRLDLILDARASQTSVDAAATNAATAATQSTTAATQSTAANGKLNANFVQFVSANAGSKTIDSVTTPKQITIEVGG